MIVAKLSLSLGGQATFCLHHLFRFIRAALEALGSVETLDVGGRMGSGIIVTDGMVARRGNSTHHARV